MHSRKKSSGYEVTSKKFKACASLICQPLSYIYATCRYFPWPFENCSSKTTLQRQNSMTNHRLMYLWQIFSKVLKKAMHCRLCQHLPTNNIMVTEEYSFRKWISTDGAAFRLTDGVLKSIWQKMHFGRIFCDLVNARITNFC